MQSDEDTADDDSRVEASLSPWDRRVLSAMAVARSARLGVIALRVVSVVVAIAAIVGEWLAVLEFDSGSNVADGAFGSLSFDVPDKYQLGRFLAGVAFPLAAAGLVFAASCLLAVYTARLDLDIVLSDEDEQRRRGDLDTDD